MMAHVWLNGRIVAADQAVVPVTDRGFTLGDGLFETIQMRDGQPRRLGDHWARLADGAAVLRLPLPLDRQQLEQAIQDLALANDWRDAALRLTISRGSGVRGLVPPDPAHPTVLLSGGPPPPPLGPARLHVARQVRRNAHSPISRCKTLSYLDNILARIEAQEAGADDALLLNGEEFAVETSIANLFVLRQDGLLLTPPLAHGALPGVRRADLLRDGAAREHPLRLSDVLAAREVFVTNALSVRPVIAIDGQMIGDGTVGAVSQTMMDRVNE